MIKYIAYCDDNPFYLNNRVINLRTAIALEHDFLPDLASQLRKNKRVLLTGDLALQKITSGKCQPIEVGIIATTGSKLADYLESIGAMPLVCFGFESPLWDQRFYTNYDSQKTNYKTRIYFEFLENRRFENGFFHAYFPRIKDIAYHRKIVSWEKKKLLSFVVSNKYVVTPSKRESIRGRFGDLIKSLLPRKLYRDKEQFLRQKYILKHELQNKRLELVRFFSEHGGLDLYGSGWDDISGLPSDIRADLKDCLSKSAKGPIKDKIQIISQYKFTLCIENGSYYGYVTEKIIDALIAGVVPIYLGAPNVTEYLPRDCFVDYRQFSNNAELLNFIRNMSASEHEGYLNAGKQFLSSTEGQKYAHRTFARFIFTKITEALGA